MDPKSFQTPLLVALFFVLAMIRVPTTWSADDPRYSNCSETIRCGNVINIGYPFWGMNRPSYCGQPELELKCEDDVPKITVNNETTLRILQVINPGQQILQVARDDYWNGYCSGKQVNTSIDFDYFRYNNSGLRNLTLFYGCSSSNTLMTFLLGSCTINGNVTDVAYSTVSVASDLLGGLCNSSVIVPIYEAAAQNIEANPSTLNDSLKGGFELQWSVNDDQCRKCRDSGGVCGYNQTTTDGFSCFCRDHPPSQTTCSPTQGSTSNINTKWKIAIGLTVGATSTIGLICAIYFFISKNKGNPLSSENPRRKLKRKKSIDAFIRSYGSLFPKRYAHSDIKKITNKFQDKLGQGGYGSVYKGKLSDGRLVAVKVLKESKGNGEEFMNEVASISRTSHVNVVTLLGFCYEKSKRALIYEFMPNGSLDKFIYNKQGALEQGRQLECKVLYDIALGIARGLEYLHQGCNMRILHFDIKPHNILLDENFCPKIADFGLSKLCERKDSIVSMVGARGTMGYIAPEVYCRNFGGVSHKSDVYSYGMMVLEMVGGRKNIDVGVSKTSEVYFPTWVHKHLDDEDMNLNLHGVVTHEEEAGIIRKLIVVSLLCIQTIPSDRPSMTKVLEMLQGSLQYLPIPPRPFVSSPVRSPETSSAT